MGQTKDKYIVNMGFGFNLQFGVPSGTWSFCLSALTFLLITTNHSAIYKLPLSKVTYPEANRAYYLRVKKHQMSCCDV